MMPLKDSLVLLSLTNALHSSKSSSAVILGENKGSYPSALASPSEEAARSPSTQPRVGLSLPNLA